jgi:hypothetical protein
MPEVTITYKKPETLKILKGLAKYFDFKVSADKSKEQLQSINGITISPKDKNADITELRQVFTGTDVDAAQLRKAWQRNM